MIQPRFTEVSTPFTVFTFRGDNFDSDEDVPATMRPAFGADSTPVVEIGFSRTGKRDYSIALTIEDLLALAGQLQIALDDLEAEADVCDDPSCAMCNEDPTDEQILDAVAEMEALPPFDDWFNYVPEDPNCCDVGCTGCDIDCLLCRDGCPCLIDLDALIFALALL